MPRGSYGRLAAVGFQPGLSPLRGLQKSRFSTKKGPQ